MFEISTKDVVSFEQPDPGRLKVNLATLKKLNSEMHVCYTNVSKVNISVGSTYSGTPVV